MKETLYFGLDIGTRTVVGVVGYKESDKFVIVDYEARSHEERAMMDGQIHDIQKVSKVVYDVKHSLENRLQTKLKEVAIAAAGRSLRTQIVEIKQDYEEIQEFSPAHIHHLELQGVEQAKVERQTKDNEVEYFCVAYSVINYYLDGYVIGNLEGHKGQSIGAKIIATFLPKQVIDSLYSVTERAELSVGHLTLEPIAAINAVIPEQIRLLNLALVDVGAGTSDIAITKEGSVVAYGMIPLAGDEVTEAIIHKYLVDFDTAEMIKIKATTESQIQFSDIMGLSQTISSEEVRETIKPIIQNLGDKVSEKIKELNGDNSPNAVFCVGGGTQMNGFIKELANNLELPEERVGVRSTSQIINIIDKVGILNSPEMITPVGICLTAVQSKYNQFTVVSLNGNKIQLLNAKKLNVMDVLIQSGIEHTLIFPKKGETLMFKINGERIRIKGENSSPATILLNGQQATLQDLIRDGDVIELEWGMVGKNATMSIKELDYKFKTIHIEGKEILLPLIKVNGEDTTLDYNICSNDNIDIVNITTLENFTEYLGIDVLDKIVTVNLNTVDIDYQLKEGDSVLFDQMPQQTLSVVKDSEKMLGTSIGSTHAQEEVYNENLYIIANNKTVVLPQKKEGYIFASIFDFIDFDLSTPQGTIQLEHNGVPGSLASPIENGDVLKIYWKK